MILNRIRQFWHALFSRMGSSEISFVRSSLNLEEQRLFFQMDRPTQTHCVRVAKTCLKIMPPGQPVNKELLIKSALLHDIGKPANAIKTLDRVMIVLIKALAPDLFYKIIKKNKSWGRLGRSFLIHVNHPDQGAQLAKQAGMSPEVVYLLKSHHQPAKAGEPLELTILRQADDLN
ncbi:HDOD domain-containing protein [Desulfotomaculum nigrificans]|uniref:HDOD domain-containing protein n=1 Tax=Desulfotomaculum nigrificans TaxID=1565 RepID=UPI0001FADE03|nr:HD domain-containing protein [Desulfotomaculum nigrificans]